MQDMQPNLTPEHGPDREGAMAKADLYKLATYSLKLFKKMQDEDQLEAWVQAKITKAADYMASVYHYLEYEMKFSEYAHQLDNAEITAESREVLKSKLMEAKSKVKELKKAQAEKVDEATVIGGGKEATCHECGGTGLVMSQGKVVPAHVQSKVDKYKRLTKATHAASKRLDRNNNGIPDSMEDDEVGEGFESDAKVGATRKTATGVHTKTDTGSVHKNTSYADGGDDDIAQRSGKGKKSHAKSQSAAEKKEKAPAQKQSPKSAKTWGMKDSEKFDNRDGAPAKPKKEKEVDETYGQGVYEGKGKPDFLDLDKDGNKKEPMKKAAKEKKVTEEPNEGNEFSGELVKAKASGAKEFKVGGKTFPVKEALKGKQKNLDVDDDGDIEADDLADLRAKKDKKVEEAKKPSAGLTKGQKSATVKSAKAGKDIGKPGKNFDKVAKAAGGGEKGEKIAAAAMWKAKSKANVKEAIAKVMKEGVFDTIGKAASTAGTALGFDTEENLAKKSPQLQQLLALRTNPEYANNPAKMAELEKRIGLQKDRVSMDRGEVMDKTGNPVLVKESADLNRMKEFLTRLNG